MRRAVFSILADNNAGVLSRVTGLFSRRGYSIDSLTAGRTNLEGLSRMTITVSGEDDVLEQIEKQQIAKKLLHRMNGRVIVLYRIKKIGILGGVFI